MNDAVSSQEKSTRSSIKPRKMDLPFDQKVPRHYFFGSPFATHMINGLNLVFPMGERFFIQSVRRYLDRIDDDPALVEQVKGFIGQEVRHGIEHERFFEILEAQGYDIQTFLGLYKRLAYETIQPRFGPKMHLSVTVALEHFTATMGQRALGTDVLSHAHPLMRELLSWHAAEEIEHKAVAFDVLRKVDDSYLLRVSGMLVAAATFIPFWLLGAFMLAKQEQDVRWGPAFLDMVRAVRGGVMGKGELLRAFVDYFRPGFHPNDIDNGWLSKRYFETHAPSREAA